MKEKTQNNSNGIVQELKENLSSVAILVIGGIVIFSLFHFAHNSRKDLADKYNCATIGHILSIKANENIDQRRNGSFAIVYSYFVIYSYQVDGRILKKKTN